MTMPILVLLPGLDGTGDFFEPLLQALDDTVHTRVIRYPVDGCYDYDLCRELVRVQLPTDGPYVLLGESFSGPIAIMLAAETPRGLAGIILSSSFTKNPRPWLSLIIRPLLPYLPFHGSGSSLRLARFLVLGRWITPGLRELHRNILGSVPATTIRRRLEAVADCDSGDALARIRVPVMCFVASHDRLIPRSAVRSIQRHAPSARIVGIEGPHCVLQCKPREAAARIQQFLQSLEQPKVAPVAMTAARSSGMQPVQHEPAAPGPTRAPAE